MNVLVFAIDSKAEEEQLNSMLFWGTMTYSGETVAESEFLPYDSSLLLQMYVTLELYQCPNCFLKRSRCNLQLKNRNNKIYVFF